MYKVYIENNVILFVEQEPTDPENEALRMHINLNDTFSITKLLQKLQFTKKLYLISDDSSALFEQFCSSLRFIEAGGGWVTDRSNRILMIFRNGKWDLPKGKREVGEAIETCAVREVSEECALAQQDLKCGELLTQTFHCYQMHGEWIVKRTSWFRMYYQKPNGCRGIRPMSCCRVRTVRFVMSSMRQLRGKKTEPNEVST